MVRTDNGGKYTGQFQVYYRSQGIRLEYTVPKTPELNGIAERMNQTIMERVRSMLAYPKLPKIYWAEALMIAFYIINMSPSVPLEGDIPQRVLSSKARSYGYLRVFGCLANVHVDKARGGNMIPRVDRVYSSAIVKMNSTIDYGT